MLYKNLQFFRKKYLKSVSVSYKEAALHQHDRLSRSRLVLTSCITNGYDCSNFPSISESRNNMKSSFSTSTLVPPYSGSRTASPTATDRGTTLPFRSLAPGPTAITVP